MTKTAPREFFGIWEMFRGDKENPIACSRYTTGKFENAEDAIKDLMQYAGLMSPGSVLVTREQLREICFKLMKKHDELIDAHLEETLFGAG
jgi:cytosine/adenosine deaminase-related metal-dependent hydrolase